MKPIATCNLTQCLMFFSFQWDANFLCLCAHIDMHHHSDWFLKVNVKGLYFPPYCISIITSYTICGKGSVCVLNCSLHTKLGRCFEKCHQQLCHHSHHLLAVRGWGFVGYWFSPSRDGFHNWLKWPGAERDGSLLKTISQPCLEQCQARDCSDAFQPQPDWQQLGVSEPSSACAPHKHP